MDDSSSFLAGCFAIVAAGHGIVFLSQLLQAATTSTIVIPTIDLSHQPRLCLGSSIVWCVVDSPPASLLHFFHEYKLHTQRV
jgi:hypothetical protein